MEAIRTATHRFIGHADEVTDQSARRSLLARSGQSNVRFRGKRTSASRTAR